jgi:hypothetical protein
VRNADHHHITTLTRLTAAELQLLPMSAHDIALSDNCRELSERLALLQNSFKKNQSSFTTDIIIML